MEGLSPILLMVHLFLMALGIGAGISIAIAAASVDDVASDAGKAVLGVVKEIAARRSYVSCSSLADRYCDDRD